MISRLRQGSDAARLGVARPCSATVMLVVTDRKLKVSLRLIFCVLDARKDIESCSNA